MSKIFNFLSKILIGLVALFAVLFSSCSFFKFKTSCDLLGLSTYREVSSGVGVVIEDGLDVTTGELKLFENLEEGSDFISIKVPINLDGSISYTLPVEAGRKDYVLTWQEGNIMQWKDISSLSLGGAGETVQVVIPPKEILENEKEVKDSTTTNNNTCSSVICAITADIDLHSDVAGILSLQNGGTGSSLEGPGEDRILFWDESLGKLRWLKIGDNLDIDDRTLDAEGGSGDSDGSGESYTGEVYTAGNGLVVSGSIVELGGSLTKNTTISQGDMNMIFNLTGAGDFDIQDNGVSSLYISGSSGKIGIGTTNPTSKMDIYTNLTAPAGYFSNLSSRIDLNPISASTAYGGLTGMSSIVYVSSSVTDDLRNTSIVGAGITVTHSGDGDIRRVGGLDIRARLNSGSATYGVEGVSLYNDIRGLGKNTYTPLMADIIINPGIVAYSSGGNTGSVRVDDVYGIYDSVAFSVWDTSSLTMNNLYGFYTLRGIYKEAGATANVTNKYDIYLDEYAGGANITNNYGLYIKEKTSGTNDFNIYSIGGRNYFGGSVGIGITSPGSYKLNVAGSFISTDYFAGDGTKGAEYNQNGLVFKDGLYTSGTFPVDTNTTYTAGNGLTLSGTEIQLGGTLSKSTSILAGNYDMVFNLNGTGNFDIQNTGVSSLYVSGSSGNVGIGTTAPDYELDVLGTIQGYNFINSAGMPVNDILLEEEVRNLSITGLTGSLGLDMTSNFVVKKAETTFNAGTTSSLSTTTLTNGNIFIAYADDTNSYGTFVIYDKTGNVVKSPTVFNSSQTDYISTSTLKNGNVLIAYSDASDSSYGKFVIYDSSGNEILSETQFYSNFAIKHITSTVLTNGNIVIAFVYDGPYRYDPAVFVVYDAAGNLLKSPTYVNSDEAGYVQVVSLTNGNFLYGYMHRPSSGFGVTFYKLFDSTGSLIRSIGSLKSGFTIIYREGIAVLNNSNILVTYSDSSSFGKFVIIDNDGNIVKSETTFNTGVSGTWDISATTLTNGNILLAYVDGSSATYGNFVIYDSLGNEVVSETTFNAGITQFTSATTLTNGNILIAYHDGDETNGNFVIYGSSGASFANMVGIGTTAPTASLHVAGTLRFSDFGAGSLITDSSGNVSVSSDERLKDVQGSFDRGLEEILELDPILYKWNETSGMETETTYAGLSAQDVQSVIPEAVDVDPNGYLTLSDRPVLAATINAIKEQQLQIEELRDILIGEGKVLESFQSSSSLDIPTTDAGILAEIQTIFEEFKEMILTLGMTSHTDELGNNYLSIDSDVKMAGDLSVLGETTTSNLTVTGNIQMGLITVNTKENSIDVLGVSCYNEDTGEESEYCTDTINDPSLSTLYLQKSSSGNLNIFNGKLVIEPNGTMRLDGNLEVTGTVNSKSVDTETVSTEKIILKNSTTEESDTPSGEAVSEPQVEEPLNLTEPCEKGEIKWDDNNIYVCTSSEIWRVSPLNDIE